MVLEFTSCETIIPRKFQKLEKMSSSSLHKIGAEKVFHNFSLYRGPNTKYKFYVTRLLI